MKLALSKVLSEIAFPLQHKIEAADRIPTTSILCWKALNSFIDKGVSYLNILKLLVQ